MHEINELFLCAEALHLVEDAEQAGQDHPQRDAHYSAAGYLCGLVADRVESIAQNLDDHNWRPTAPQDGQERTVTH